MRVSVVGDGIPITAKRARAPESQHLMAEGRGRILRQALGTFNQISFWYVITLPTSTNSGDTQIFMFCKYHSTEGSISNAEVDVKNAEKKVVEEEEKLELIKKSRKTLLEEFKPLMPLRAVCPNSQCIGRFSLVFAEIGG